MKLTINDARRIYSAMQAMDWKVPIQASFRLARFKNKLKPIIDESEKERLNLVKKYAPDGGDVPKDKIPAFTEEWDQFSKAETEDIKFEKIPLGLLGDTNSNPNLIADMHELFEE